MLMLAAVAVVLAGCGALFNNGPANVMVTSSPNEAEVWMNGNRVGTTPMALSLKKNQDHSIVFKKPGFQESAFNLNRQISAGYVILDVLGGLLPVIIDAATGSWYTLSTNAVNMNLAAVPESDGLVLRGTLTPEQLEAVKNGQALSAALLRNLSTP